MMKILLVGDIVGNSGCKAVKKNLPNLIRDKNLDFVVVNGENAAKNGAGITENITSELLSIGVDVITTGNHVWDQKEIMEFINKEERLLRPKNLFEPAPGIWGHRKTTQLKKSPTKTFRRQSTISRTRPLRVRSKSWKKR